MTREPPPQRERAASVDTRPASPVDEAAIRARIRQRVGFDELWRAGAIGEPRRLPLDAERST